MLHRSRLRGRIQAARPRNGAKGEIMHRPVRFADDIEPLVQFIEETDPSRILETTLGKLREGLSVKKLLTASALAVTRSSDLPPGHHGGPLHPLVGLHALHSTVERVSGEQRFLPILQHVALSNKHINHPGMGPYILADAKPVDSGGVEGTKKAFFAAVDRGLYNAADHAFLWLWDKIPHAEALDLLLTVAIPKNILDDHYFIFPMFTWRALDWLGREYTSFLMRPAVRYVSRFPTPPSLRDIEPLLEEYELLTRPLGFHTSPDETPAIGLLGEAITGCDALSIGAAGLFMRSLTGNPMDVHLHTGVNLRRYLLKLEGVSLRNKLLALLTWHTGPEVRSTQNRMEPPPQPDPQAVAALPHRTQSALLDALAESIFTQPPTDWSKVTNLGQMRAVPEVKNTVTLAQQYADLNYDPNALISRLAKIVVHDNFTEMHAFKHHQATFEEFHATRLPWRWRHLLSAAQASAISYGKNMEIYEEAVELLHA